jgi:hypothetical protein
MALIDSILTLCRRLAPLGWAALLKQHGLNLNGKTLRNAYALVKELERPLPVDRSVPGFEDFCPGGNRAVFPGRPSRSLLYHALASPLVHPASAGTVKASSNPTLKELDTIENYIYSRNDKSISDFLKEKGKDTDWR